MKFGFIILFGTLALFQITEVDSVKWCTGCTLNKLKTSTNTLQSNTAGILWRANISPATIYKSSHTKISNSLSVLRTIHSNVNDRLIGTVLKGETFPVFYRIVWDFINTGATDLTKACTQFDTFSSNFSSSCSDIAAYSSDHSSQLSTHNANLSSLVTNYCTALKANIGTTVTDAVSAQLASQVTQINAVLTAIRDIFQIETRNIFPLSIITENIIKLGTGSFTNSSTTISGSISSTSSLTNIYVNVWNTYARILLLRQSSLYSSIAFWATSSTWNAAWTGTLKARFEASYNSVVTELQNMNTSVFDCNYNYASDIYAEYNTVLAAMITELVRYWDYVVDKVYEVWGTSSTCAIRAQSGFLSYIYFSIPKMKSCASSFNYKLSQALFSLQSTVVNVYIKTLIASNGLFSCPIKDRTSPSTAVSCMDSAITELETTVTAQLALLSTAKTTYCNAFTDTSSLFTNCTTLEFTKGQSQLNTANGTFSSCL